MRKNQFPSLTKSFRKPALSASETQISQSLVIERREEGQVVNRYTIYQPSWPWLEYQGKFVTI
jgi:hypothetical protein